MALVNSSTYSYDCMDGRLRTVLIRSAPFARHNPNQVPRDDDHAWEDQGRQERTFWLLAGKGRYTQLNLDRRADELQTPAEHVMDSGHAGHLPWEGSFLRVAPDNVEVLAVKRAEGAENNTVIRLEERAGAATTALVKSEALGVDREVSLRPWELKTVVITRGSGGNALVQETSSMEE